MSPAAIISLDGLCFSYDRSSTQVIKNLSLKIPASQVTAILGPNGSGKTTLLHLLLGILPPSSGSITLAGKPHHHYTRQSLSQVIGLVPQEEHVPFDFSVLEYVLLGRAPYLGLLEMPGEADRQIALDALNTAGVASLGGRPVPSLSGGERQLVTIARALAQQPRVILLDEPTSHLDVANKRRILNILTALAESGVSVVFSTHDPNAASATARHIVLMKDGEVLADGPTEEVFNSQNLTTTYGVPIEVVQVHGHLMTLA